MRFGTAGIPLRAKGTPTSKAVRVVRELGLGAMELEFVRGVHMSMKAAEETKKEAEANDVVLSVHAPYWINLNAKEEKKRRQSIKRIIDSAVVGAAAGARNIVFHPAYYLDDPPDVVFGRVKEALLLILEELDKRGVSVTLRPETTGKPTQFGSLEETIALAEELPNVLPCVDFAHLHARSGGAFNSYEEFSQILKKIREGLGEKALKDMHVHVSGIEYTQKGEREHLNLQESDLRWQELLRALHDAGADGVIISESPNIEGDALLMKEFWEELSSR